MVHKTSHSKEAAGIPSRSKNKANLLPFEEMNASLNGWRTEFTDGDWRKRKFKSEVAERRVSQVRPWKPH